MKASQAEMKAMQQKIDDRQPGMDDSWDGCLTVRNEDMVKIDDGLPLSDRGLSGE
jgi:hypothetical protein